MTGEVSNNLRHLHAIAVTEWDGIQCKLSVVDDIFTLDWPAAFVAGKDRPILFSALAWADVLLTLDRRDFRVLMSEPFYGLHIMTPGSFLQRERAASRFK